MRHHQTRTEESACANRRRDIGLAATIAVVDPQQAQPGVLLRVAGAAVDLLSAVNAATRRAVPAGSSLPEKPCFVTGVKPRTEGQRGASRTVGLRAAQDNRKVLPAA